MNHPSPSSRKRFSSFLRESISNQPSVVQFQVGFDTPSPDPVDAIAYALKTGSWIIDSFGIEEGGVALRPILDGLGIVGWEFLVISPDAKVGSLLSASLMNGYLGENVIMHQQPIFNSLLGESGWRGIGSAATPADRRWFTLAEIRKGL